MSTATDYDALIRDHYRRQADKHGDSERSTMEDDVIRAKETEAIEDFVRLLDARHPSKSPLRILDLGCGNGHTLHCLSEKFPGHLYSGGEFCDTLLNIARRRSLEHCEFVSCDARDISFADNALDAVFTQRCLINILDWEDQLQALREIARVLKPGGHYLMIECFTDGLENNNKARTECGLEALQPAHHNRYFDKNDLFEAIDGMFRVADPGQLSPGYDGPLCDTNFLSSHYFVARVLHPLVTQGEWIRNTQFVKFFAALLPPVGNYSPIQLHLFTKCE
ncbi:MAG: class I SAM-dependent methyltransferase [Thermoguttaceae bacterium]